MLIDLRAYILADTTVSGLIGTRFHFERIPQNAAFPNCEFSIIDERVLNTHGSDENQLNSDLIQIDVYAKTGLNSLEIKDALKDRLNSKAFTQGTTRFGFIQWDSNFSGYEPNLELFTQTITLEVKWSDA
tara:strand:+ start:461 stop:850 length:390 start_codon:yes stop_codon:yes gene_type:complete